MEPKEQVLRALSDNVGNRLTKELIVGLLSTVSKAIDESKSLDIARLTNANLDLIQEIEQLKILHESCKTEVTNRENLIRDLEIEVKRLKDSLRKPVKKNL